MTMPTLPVIRFDGTSEDELAAAFDAAFTGIGFCYLSDIGVSPRSWKASSLPPAVFTPNRGM